MVLLNNQTQSLNILNDYSNGLNQHRGLKPVSSFSYLVQEYFAASLSARSLFRDRPIDFPGMKSILNSSLQKIFRGGRGRATADDMFERCQAVLTL